ncbi:MAG: sensor domain-containing diguanylate cyclase, partial [Spirochaetales bacterium]|nr:sensor domain-containing diguanylate cyclase [Spirochaetales bacterium]
MDSILFTCMGQMQVLKIGLFTKKAIDHDYFSLHRNYKGFEIDHTIDCTIPEKSALTAFLADHHRCFTMPELLNKTEKVAELKLFTILEPTLIVPLIIKGAVNGIIILGDRIDGVAFKEEEKDYLMDISTFASIAIQNAFLFEMTTTDMMTKLKLRHFFFANLIEHQEISLSKGIPVSVIMLDIDHFKKLNDTYGHTFGDIVLKQISAIVRNSIRRIDIAARYGGEEFIILLPGVEAAEAMEVAERIRKAIEATIFKNGEVDVTSTISLGVAQFDKNRDLTSEDLIKRADKALYVSKETGRNR